jgi:TPR repeat protein
VIEGYDLAKTGFDRKVREFAAALQGANAGLFFFAGHGLQVAGQNYLVPVDAQLTTPAALEFEMVRVDVAQRVMEQQASTNILFLDACRDNPLARNLARAMGTRSAEIGRGLAPLVSGVGTLISFSTQPGNTALDGTGRNSPFAGALVRHISSSKDDLSAILISVRNDVMRETQEKQVPWEHSALRGRFYFNVAQASGLSPHAWQLSEAAEAWDRTKDSNSISVLELFVARYPDSYYADLARLSISDLKKRQAAATSAPAPKAIDKGVEKRAAEKAAQVQRDVEEGDRNYDGRGVPRDFPKAAQAYEKAASAGNARAMNILGWLYENGLGVAKDLTKAREWYEKSAALGYLYAVNNTGRMYREGWGVPQDYAKARELSEKAAAAGNTEAMVSLGWLYQNGWGVARDYAKARELYEKALAAGDYLPRHEQSWRAVPGWTGSRAGLWQGARVVRKGRGGGQRLLRDAQPWLALLRRSGGCQGLCQGAPMSRKIRCRRQCAFHGRSWQAASRRFGRAAGLHGCAPVVGEGGRTRARRKHE